MALYIDNYRNVEKWVFMISESLLMSGFFVGHFANKWNWIFKACYFQVENFEVKYQFDYFQLKLKNWLFENSLQFTFII